MQRCAFVLSVCLCVALGRYCVVLSSVSVRLFGQIFLEVQAIDMKLTAIEALAKNVSGLPSYNTTALRSAIALGLADGKNISTQFETMAASVKSYNGSRSSVQLVAGYVSLLLVFVALIGACCSFPKFALVLGLFGFFALGFAWIAFALNYAGLCDWLCWCLCLCFFVTSLCARNLSNPVFFFFFFVVAVTISDFCTMVDNAIKVRARGAC